MAWPLLVLLLALLFPVWEMEERPEGGFVVLAISGAIEAEGPPPPEPRAVCGRPFFDAGYNLDTQVVEVTERVRPAWAPRLLVAEDIPMEDPAGAISCGPWPTLTASRDGALTWTWSLHGHEVSLPVERHGDLMRVEGRTLAPGESFDVPVSFTWDAPWGATYSYEGTLHVEHRGVWPADALRTVESVDWGATWRVEGEA